MTTEQQKRFLAILMDAAQRRAEQSGKPAYEELAALLEETGFEIRVK